MHIKSNAYFGLKESIHTQDFRRNFEVSSSMQHPLAIEFGDGLKNFRVEEVILPGEEPVVQKLAMKKQNQINVK